MKLSTKICISEFIVTKCLDVCESSDESQKAGASGYLPLTLDFPEKAEKSISNESEEYLQYEEK